MKTIELGNYILTVSNNYIGKRDWCYETETNEVFCCEENLIDSQDCIIDTSGKSHITGHDPFHIYRIESLVLR